MNSYRITAEISPAGRTEPVHVYTTTREKAVYAAFDELADKGHSVYRLADVHMWDDVIMQWVVTHDHKTVSAMVR